MAEGRMWLAVEGDPVHQGGEVWQHEQPSDGLYSGSRE